MEHTGSVGKALDRDTPPVEQLCSILKQGTLSIAKYWFNHRRQEIFSKQLKNC